MDNGPLWSQDDAGHYWLVFPNKHALDKEEIKDIFSKFGKVKNVTTAGNEKGLRFVQYTSLQDVENAVENLKHHPTVKLIPHRQKNKQTANTDGGSKENLSNNFDSQQANTNINNDKRNFYQRKPPMDNIERNRCKSITTNSEQKSILEQLKKLKVPSSNNVSVCSSNLSDDENSFSEQSITGNKSSARSLERSSPPKLNGSLSNIEKYRAQNYGSELTSEKMFINNKTNLCLTQDELPKLITMPNTRSTKQQPKQEFIKAEEVIVGNIHNDYGCAYILHMFEKFDPLAISYMQTVPESGIRYCHVYFKTLQDSLNVERLFDQFSLSSQKLIVLRPCRLIEKIE